MRGRLASWWLLPLLGGCLNQVTSFGLMADRTSAWYETGAVPKPLPEIARIVQETLIRQGYQIPAFDPNSGSIETAWNTSMSPRWRESVRSLVEVEIVAAERGGFNVRIRSVMEINDASSHPGEADRASWVGAGVSDRHRDHIPEPAMKLHNVLKLRFFGLNP